jgi:lipid-A-disaccharide synthase
MEQVGGEFIADLTRLAVMGIGPVLGKLPAFLRLLRQAGHFLRSERPHAVILIDFPGFHWHVARIAKAEGIPVIYYGVPQLWAWAPWRVAKMRRRIDLALCKLPFEADWFRARGVNAQSVGHPYYDELTERQLDQEFVQEQRQRSERLITLLPGSRDQEVRQVLPWLLSSAARIGDTHPKCGFAVASHNERQAAMARQMIERAQLRIPAYVHRTPELIEAATCCIACSGSVTLELLYHRTPSVIVYRLGALTHLIQNVFRTAKYISLPNLLATSNIRRSPFQSVSSGERDALPFPEFLSVRDCSRDVARTIDRWLLDPTAYGQKVVQLEQLAKNQIAPGASHRAAEIILRTVLEHPLTTSHPDRGPIVGPTV